jgi:hypothetical protein
MNVDCSCKGCDERPLEAEEPKVTDVAQERMIVAKAFPRIKGTDRTIAHLFEHEKSQFFRVNFYDDEKEVYVRSCFVEVTDGEAREWPKRQRRPGLWANS